MNHKTLSIVLVSAVAMSVQVASAADATQVEAADKQFLANLERADARQGAAATPTIEVVKPAPAPAPVPVAEGPAVKKETRVVKKQAPPKNVTASTTRESTVRESTARDSLARESAATESTVSESTARESAKVAKTAKRSTSRVSHTRREEVPARTEFVEVRRAIPVTTTTVVTTTRRDHPDDDDHDDDDHDHDHDRGNGFFNRLFSGER